MKQQRTWSELPPATYKWLREYDELIRDMEHAVKYGDKEFLLVIIGQIQAHLDRQPKEDQ